MTEIGNVTARVDAVITDEQYRDAMGAVRAVNERIDLLKTENAKLRELAKEACEMARTFYNLGGTFNDLDDLLCEAAELGVEVDE